MSRDAVTKIPRSHLRTSVITRTGRYLINNQALFSDRVNESFAIIAKEKIEKRKQKLKEVASRGQNVAETMQLHFLTDQVGASADEYAGEVSALSVSAYRE